VTFPELELVLVGSGVSTAVGGGRVAPTMLRSTETAASTMLMMGRTLPPMPFGPCSSLRPCSGGWTRLSRRIRAKTTRPTAGAVEKVRTARATAAAREMANIRRVADGGIVTKVTTHKLRDPATGQIVEETVEDRTVPNWRADA